MTVGGDASVYGDRTPAMWFHNSVLHICSAVNDNLNACYNQEMPAGHWIPVEIEQNIAGI